MSELTEVEDRTAPLVPDVTPTTGTRSRPAAFDDEIDRLERALGRGA